jgi:diguanylate cyclase (GGDEF)-like protein
VRDFPPHKAVHRGEDRGVTPALLSGASSRLPIRPFLLLMLAMALLGHGLVVAASWLGLGPGAVFATSLVAPMTFSSALVLACLATALLLHQTGRTRGARRAAELAGLLLALVLLRLLLLPLPDLDAHSLLLREHRLNPVATPWATLMAPATWLAFAALALALWLPARWRHSGLVLAGLATALGLLAMSGWILGLTALQRLGAPVPMAPETALDMSLLGAAVLVARRHPPPDSGPRWPVLLVVMASFSVVFGAWFAMARERGLQVEQATRQAAAKAAVAVDQAVLKRQGVVRQLAERLDLIEAPSLAPLWALESRGLARDFPDLDAALLRHPTGERLAGGAAGQPAAPAVGSALRRVLDGLDCDRGGPDARLAREGELLLLGARLRSGAGRCVSVAAAFSHPLMLTRLQDQLEPGHFLAAAPRGEVPVRLLAEPALLARVLSRHAPVTSLPADEVHWSWPGSTLVTGGPQRAELILLLAGLIVSAAVSTALLLSRESSRLDREALAAAERLRHESAARQAADAELGTLRSRLVHALESMSEGFLLVDRDHRLAFLNQQAAALLTPLRGRPPEPGQPMTEVLDDLVLEALRGPWRSALQRGRTETFDVHDEARDQWLTVRLHPSEQGVAVFLTDSTQRKHEERDMRFRSAHDGLTRLANRSLLLDRTSQALALARRSGNSVGLLYLDLDQFKSVNDTVGHDAGNEVLIETARRLEAGVRPGDTAARLGGDEFAVLLPDLAHPDDVIRVVEPLLAALAQPMELQGRLLPLSASIGVALYEGRREPPGQLLSAQELVARADMAMYAAKNAGRNAWHLYSSELGERVRQRIAMRGRLQQALQVPRPGPSPLYLVYQPQYLLDGSRLSGIECLLRWEDAELGAVGPAEFIPLAEESSLIHDLGRWVLDEACRQARAWRDAGWLDVPLAVNVSSLQFQRGDFLDVVRDSLARHRLPPQALELELTESVMLDQGEALKRMLDELRALGVRLSIDDFGTGFSSLSYLTRLPVHRIKIDRSFIAGLPGDTQNASVTEGIIAMAHHLDLPVVAEGVETAAQRDLLARLGCDEAQGWFYARPLDAGTMALRLRGARGLSPAAEPTSSPAA